MTATTRTVSASDAIELPDDPAKYVDPPVGNPATIALPTFMLGSMALGLSLTGYVPPAAAGAAIPIIMTASAFGLVVSAIWAASLAQNALASIFGVFAGFWTSYAALVLGLSHNWFGVAPTDALGAQKLYLLSWLVVMLLLTLVTLRLPSVFSLFFVVIDLALLFVFLGASNASVTETKTGGWLVLSFVVFGAYLYVDAMNTSTGGKGLPLGRPVMR